MLSTSKSRTALFNQLINSTKNCAHHLSFVLLGMLNYHSPTLPHFIANIMIAGTEYIASYRVWDPVDLSKKQSPISFTIVSISVKSLEPWLMSINTHNDWLRYSHPGFSVMVKAMDFHLIFEEQILAISLNLKREACCFQSRC